MNLANTDPSTNVIDCIPYSAPMWADVLSSFSLVFACFVLLSLLIYGAMYATVSYFFKKHYGKPDDTTEYSDYP